MYGRQILNSKYSSIYLFAGERPSCEDTTSMLTNAALERLQNGTLENCVANEVPGTFSHFGVCSSASCIPLDFCLTSDQ